MSAKVILTVIDACRPDGLAQARTPHLDRLWQSGAYTWTAQTVVTSSTLTAHLSMFRGVTPAQHGVMDNTFNPSASVFPSIMDGAREAGLRTAAFFTWGELRDLWSPGGARMSYCRAATFGDDTDDLLPGIAAAHIIAEGPDLVFFYLGNTDLTGHAHGWMSPPYLAAIEQADAQTGALLGLLKAAGVEDRYTHLILADHGGHDHAHGTDLPEDVTIPWILSGPGAKRDHAIQTPVSICDTAATIAYLLDLPQPDVWDGRPVYDALV